MKRPPENARILIIKTHAIGDLLMTTPAIRDLRRAYPKAHIALLVGKWSASALRDNPHLNQVLEFDDEVLLRGRFFDALRLLARVRSERFDAAVIFHPSPLLHAFAWLAGIPLRYGLRRGSRNGFLTAGVAEDLGPDTYYPVNFQRVAALAGAMPGEPDLEVHATAEDAAVVGRLLAEAGMVPGEPYILAAPGGGRNSKDDVAAKRWPAEHFVSLLLRARARWPEVRIVLVGSPADAAETSAVRAAIPEAVDCTGRTSLGQLFCLAGGARAVVCNDSALLHIAVAQGTPTVVPFGPTSLERFVPPRARALSVKSGIACSPCYVGGNFPGCAIGFQCMRELAPEALWARLEEALQAGRAGARLPL
jgi:lipopolysaccharide heptosyltransferase II